MEVHDDTFDRRRWRWCFASLALAPCRSYAWGIDYQDTYLSIRYVPERQAARLLPSTRRGGRQHLLRQWLDLRLQLRQHRLRGLLHAATRRTAVVGKSRTPTPSRCTPVPHGAQRQQDLRQPGFSFGPIRDVGLELGFDIDTQNDVFASYKKLLIVRAAVLDQPAARLLDHHARAVEGVEHQRLSNGNGTNYNPTFEIETAWSFPFAIGAGAAELHRLRELHRAEGHGRHRRLRTTRRRSCCTRS